MTNLDLSPIGNSSISALIDGQGRYLWFCAPRIDSDPFFCSLLTGQDEDAPEARGLWSVDVVGAAGYRQSYLRNTAVLRTEITDADGHVVEILDFAPRFKRSGRTYRPMSLVRLVRPVAGAPRISVRLRPTADYGARICEHTYGSNHVRYLGADVTLRLTTNAPVGQVLAETPFRLEEPLAFFLGPDEPFTGPVLSTVQGMLDDTIDDWREWVRTLYVPLDYQDVVIRAAIGLKLCVYEETGAIVAAMTTSLPEAPHSGRDWDYRFCWIRDAYYVIQALNRLGAADILENYLGFLRNIVDETDGGHIQPLWGVGREAKLVERIERGLPGYRGMGPVRVGNQAYEHVQHDVYGQIVLSNVQAFFDQRLLREATREDFEALEKVGERAFLVFDQPDAGLWELRTRAAVHTYSAVMCWAACDRLGNAAEKLGLPDRAAFWNDRAATMRATIEARAWNAQVGHFAATFGGDELDASLLQMVDLRFLKVDDPRNMTTVKAVEAALMRDGNLMRYDRPDDFGAPETAFNFCTFWFIEALHLVGETDRARGLFDQMLQRRTRAGLLSEDVSLSDGELWGNYPQTYSLVGLINCAVLLSRPWSAVR
jgi:GH15 family glucan-1,4-alpha-glucosidase